VWQCVHQRKYYSCNVSGTCFRKVSFELQSKYVIYVFTSVQYPYADSIEDISVRKGISTFGTVDFELGSSYSSVAFTT